MEQRLEHAPPPSWIPRSNPRVRWVVELGTAPVVLRGAALAQHYRGSVLLPTARFVNGYPAWSAADGSLHLYRNHTDESWKIRIGGLKPDDDKCTAHVRATKGAPPPAGETAWFVTKSLMNRRLGAWPGGDGSWQAANLTLLLGADARAVVSPQQVSARIRSAECDRRSVPSPARSVLSARC